MDMDFGGLAELFIRLDESGNDSPNPFLFLRNLVEFRRGLNKMNVNMNLKIKGLDEFKAMSRLI